MKSRKENQYDRFNVKIPLKPIIRNPLLLAILGATFGLAVLVTYIVILWGSGPAIVAIPWLQPALVAFVTLTTLSYLIVLFGLLSEYLRLLRSQNERLLLLDAILQNIPIGLAVTGGPPDFRIEMVSRHGLEMTQQPLENLASSPSGQHPSGWKIFYPDGITQPQPEQMPLYKASRIGEETRNLELLVEAQDGRRIPVLVSAAPIRNSRGEIVAAINTWMDITERKRSEEALQDSEQRYRGLFEMMQEGLVAAQVITDAKGNPVDYRYLDVNPAAERYFGMTRDQFVGHTFREVLPAADPGWVDVLGRVALTGEPVNLEKYGVVTGLWFRTSAYSPAPGQFVHILTDITESKRVEQALQRSQRVLAQAGRMARLGAWESPLSQLDSINDNPLYWSEEVFRLFGYEPDEVEVSNELFFSHVPPEDRSRIEQAVAKAIAEHQVYTIEHRIIRKDGSERIVLESAEIQYDDQGKPARVIGAVQDITERKQAEAALRKHAAELERANRDLKNFTVVASHDLQEPLRKIEALGDSVLRSTANLDEQLSDRIQRMRKAAQQMRNMVSGLQQLSFITTDIQPFQPVDLHRVATEVIQALDRKIQLSGGSVEIGELAVVEADPRQMRILLQHLIENALKFQPKGGKPEVRISSRHPTPDTIQILVEDNGIGFEETHAGYLFKPFERLVGKNQLEYDGIGMGLAICRWIVERHGGEIAARSAPGKGTSFIVRLPVCQ